MTADEKRKLGQDRLLAALLVAAGAAWLVPSAAAQEGPETAAEAAERVKASISAIRGTAIPEARIETNSAAGSRTLTEGSVETDKVEAAEIDALLQGTTTIGQGQDQRELENWTLAPPTLRDNRFYQLEATDQRLRRVVKVLKAETKTDVNQYVPVAFDFRNVSPYNVLRYVRRTADIEEGNYWTFVAPDGKSGVLLVNIPIWQVEPMRELVSIIDRADQTTSDGRRREFYRLKHRDPNQIAAALVPYLTGSGFALPDPATGSVYIDDAPSGTGYAVDYLPKDLDIPIRQVVIRAKIYEVDLTNDGKIGLDYMSWKNGPGRNLFALGGFSEFFKQNESAGGAPPVVSPGGVDVNGLPAQRFNNSGLNAAYYYNVPSAYFDFLVTKGRARVLTAPSATVLNTETASFTTGEKILYYRVRTQDDLGVRDRPLNPTGGSDSYPDNRTVTGEILDSEDAGVKLEVKPIIGEESVVLNISLEFANSLGFDGAGMPMLQKRDLTTTLRATPDKEYIIGGMTRTTSVQAGQKVPVLGSLPVAGWLFGGESTQARKTMLAIVLTADVLDEASTMTPDEAQLVQRVSTAGMNQIPLPGTLWAFDMMLLGKEAAK